MLKYFANALCCFIQHVPRLKLRKCFRAFDFPALGRHFRTSESGWR